MFRARLAGVKDLQKGNGMKRGALAAMAAVFSLSCVSPVLAQDAEPSGPKAEEALFGEFAAGDNQLIFEDNGTPGGGEQFRLVDAEGILLTRGVYLVVGDQIYISDIEGEQTCPITVGGRYQFVRNGDALELTQVSDRCEGRRERLNAAEPPEPEEEEAAQPAAAEGEAEGEEGEGDGGE